MDCREVRKMKCSYLQVKRFYLLRLKHIGHGIIAAPVISCGLCTFQKCLELSNYSTTDCKEVTTGNICLALLSTQLETSVWSCCGHNWKHLSGSTVDTAGNTVAVSVKSVTIFVQPSLFFWFRFSERREHFQIQR